MAGVLKINSRRLIVHVSAIAVVLSLLVFFGAPQQTFAEHGGSHGQPPPPSGPPKPAPAPGPAAVPPPSSSSSSSTSSSSGPPPSSSTSSSSSSSSNDGNMSGGAAREDDKKTANDMNQGTGPTSIGKEDREDDKKPATAQQDDRKPATGQQDGRPATGQQEGRPATGQQAGRPATAQPAERPATGQQDGRPATGQQAGAGRPATGQQDGRPAARAVNIPDSVTSQQEGRPATGQQDREPATTARPTIREPAQREPEREDKRDSAATGLSGCMASAQTAVARSACVSSARPQIREFEKERQPIVDRGGNQQGVAQEGQGRDREGQEVRSDDANQGGGGQGQSGQAREGDQGDNRAVQPGGTPGGGIAPKPGNVYRGNDWSDKADRWVETTTEFDEDGNITAIRKGQTRLDDGKFEDSMLTREASTVGYRLPTDTELDRSRETRRTAYDTNGNISVVLTTDREGNETMTEYDSEGRITWKESRDKKGDLLSAEIPTGERGGETAGLREQCMQGRGGVAETVCDAQAERGLSLDGHAEEKPVFDEQARGSEEMKAPKRGSSEYDERLYGQDSGEVVLDKKGGIRRTQTVNQGGSLTIREFDAEGAMISSNTLGARSADGKFMSSTNDKLVGCRVGQDAGECASADQLRVSDGHQCDQGAECEGDGSETSWRAPEGGGKYDDISARLSTSEERGQGGEIKSRVLKYQGGEESALTISHNCNQNYDSADAGTCPSTDTMERLRETSDGGGVERANAFTADESGKLKMKSEWENRTAYAEDGQVDKVESFARDTEGAVSFGADDLKAKRNTADAAPAQTGSGGEVSVSDEPSVKPRTGFSIKQDKGGRPVLAVSGESASNEGGISMDSGLDGFVLGFLPKYERGEFDKKKGRDSRSLKPYAWP